MLVAVATKTLALNKGEKHVHFFMLDIQISKRVRAKISHSQKYKQRFNAIKLVFLKNMHLRKTSFTKAWPRCEVIFAGFWQFSASEEGILHINAWPLCDFSFSVHQYDKLILICDTLPSRLYIFAHLMQILCILYYCVFQNMLWLLWKIILHKFLGNNIIITSCQCSLCHRHRSITWQSSCKCG